MRKVLTFYGWSNRETWLASLWLSNTLELYEALLDVTTDCSDVKLSADRLRIRLAEQLDETKVDSGFWRDLRRVDLEKVNWREVVEAHQE